MLRALISSCSTTASHPLTLGTTWSTRMSSLPIFSTPGSSPHKGVSSQPCKIVPCLDFLINKLVSPPSQNLAYALFPFLLFFFTYHPRPPTSTASRRYITFNDLRLALSHCLQSCNCHNSRRAYGHASSCPCPQVVVDPTVDPKIVQVSCSPARTPHFVLLRVLWGAAYSNTRQISMQYSPESMAAHGL